MVADDLRRGTLLTVTAASGAESKGYVCDRDGLGLLLDLHDGPGYRFYPWSSVEHVTIQEARHLRPGEAVLPKSLPEALHQRRGVELL